MNNLRLQYRFIFLLHAIVIALMLASMYSLWITTGSILHFDMLILVFTLVILLIMSKARFDGYLAQIQDGTHICVQKQYLGICSLCLDIVFLIFYLYNIQAAKDIFFSTELTLIMMFSNYELYQQSNPILVVKDQKLFFGLRWVDLNKISEVHMDSYRKNIKRVVIYERKRYVQSMNTDHLAVLKKYFPEGSLKD